MLRVQAGDLGAFEELVGRFQSVVYGLAMSMLRRPEDAEEAAQDAFLKLFRARDRFDGERNFGPWLLRIAGNACRDRLRRRRTAEATLQPRDGDRDPMLELADGEWRRDGQEHVVPTVRGELDRLSDKVRLPIELKYLRGLTNQQIAESLGISISNVKVQLARGKDILASRLQAIGEEFGRQGVGRSGVGSPVGGQVDGAGPDSAAGRAADDGGRS